MKMTEVCGWCGRDINGESVLPYEQGEVITGGSDRDDVVVHPGFKVVFCCSGCAWAFFAEIHKLWGLNGEELRRHLIDVEGLPYPPGKRVGKMSRECFLRLQDIALVVGSWIEGGMPEVKFKNN
jgi:hypothetical protein